MREVILLGSTGSIGTQAVDVVRADPERFRVVGLAAGGRDLDTLAEQAVDLGVAHVAVAAESAIDDLRSAIAVHAERRGRAADFSMPELTAGPDAATDLATAPCDLVLNAIDGSRGLPATLAALRAGRTVALANKESLVAGGPLVRELAGPDQLIPVDSEHTALAQCLRGAHTPDEVRRLIITASGGPFRGRRREELADVGVDAALAHPTWAMGRLITMNSATLINKGLEVIEGHELFRIPYDRIDVVVQPTSMVHGMVEFCDGSTLLQASPPDMRLTIGLAMAWPERVADVAPACDWTRPTTWAFEPLDADTFPAVRLAKEAGAAGGTAPAVYNAANETGVAAFLDHRLPFLGIVDTVARVLDEHRPDNVSSLDDVLEAERWARARAEELVAAGTARAGTGRTKAGAMEAGS